jgi:L-alanine-DL-glutamate epimerase-like enolase superfamily enzyme
VHLPTVLADLPVAIEDFALEPLSFATPNFERLTTVVALAGAGHVGRGEDVAYEPATQLEHRATRPFSLTGTATLAEWSSRLDDVELFADEPENHASRDYRRWAYESALLDLGLRQAGTTLGALLGRTPAPVRFCVSSGLGPAVWLAVDPALEFKLDAGEGWTAEHIAGLQALDRVRVVDIKAQYGDAWGLSPAAARQQLELVVAGMPEVIIEDPPIDDHALAVLAGQLGRVSFDAPVHALSDILHLPQTGWMNIKPSRFGTIARLLEAIDHCERHGIRLYGGGQFELGVGRRQIQELAALFYPEGPNDVAPGAYNATHAAAGLPQSPLMGFGTSAGFGT